MTTTEWVQANIRPRGDHGGQGFSLLETVAVLALLAILLGLGVPSYVTYSSTQRTRTAAQLLVRDLQVARQEAIKRRAPLTVRFTSADRVCAGVGGGTAYTLQQGTTVLKRTCFPADVEWMSAPAAGLAFLSTGAVDAGGRIQLRSRRSGRTYTVQVGADTGVITHDAR